VCPQGDAGRTAGEPPRRGPGNTPQ
jgi:hypothetical protein